MVEECLSGMLTIYKGADEVYVESPDFILYAKQFAASINFFWIFVFFYWIFNFACGHCAVLWNSCKNKRKLLGAIGRVYRKCCGFTANLQRRPSMMTTRSFLLLFFVLSRNALHSHLLLLISPCVSVYVSFLLFHPSRNDCLCGFPTQIQRGAPPTLGTLF